MGDKLPVVNLGAGLAAVDIAGGWYAACVVFSTQQMKCFGTAGDVLGYGDNVDRISNLADSLPFIDLNSADGAGVSA
eukprot:1843874-Amphidinium_carterae.2